MKTNEISTIVLPKIYSLNSEIEYFHFHTYPKQISLQENFSDLSESEGEIIKTALQIRDELDVPFWDSFQFATMKSPNFSTRLLQKVQRHNQKILKKFKSSELWKLDSLLSNEDEVLAINSLTLVKNEMFHIPMIDFHCPHSEENVLLVSNVIMNLNLGNGFLVHSGQSFHFYGFKLISANDLSHFLGRILLYAPIIDRAWVAHQLIDNNCSLRMGPKNGLFPRIIKEI